jgi:antitoxin PrlF
MTVGDSMELIMTNPTYPLAPAKIGNASGFRLPASFYRDHPQFVNATGWVEVLSDDTVLVKLEPQTITKGASGAIEPVSDSDDLMLSLFLDLITKDALTNPENLEAYTQEMSDDDDELITGVAIN